MVKSSGWKDVGITKLKFFCKDSIPFQSLSNFGNFCKYEHSNQLDVELNTDVFEGFLVINNVDILWFQGIPWRVL